MSEDLAWRLSLFRPGTRVIYVPGHAHGDPDHPDCERGTVSSVNERFVFVKFGDQAPQACDPQTLVILAELSNAQAAAWQASRPGEPVPEMRAFVPPMPQVDVQTGGPDGR